MLTRLSDIIDFFYLNNISVNIAMFALDRRNKSLNNYD